MYAKLSGFVIYVKSIICLLLYKLHESSFKSGSLEIFEKNFMITVLPFQTQACAKNRLTIIFHNKTKLTLKIYHNNIETPYWGKFCWLKVTKLCRSNEYYR